MAEYSNDPERILADVTAEVGRQNRSHKGYPATRDGVFLAIKTAVHELDREAVEAWHTERCKCRTPGCEHPKWAETETEMIQAVAVLLRSVAAIRMNRALQLLEYQAKSEARFGAR